MNTNMNAMERIGLEQNVSGGPRGPPSGHGGTQLSLNPLQLSSLQRGSSQQYHQGSHYSHQQPQYGQGYSSIQRGGGGGGGGGGGHPPSRNSPPRNHIGGNNMPRGYSTSMDSDITSTAGYTLSGGHQQQQQQEQGRQLSHEHVEILLQQGFSLGLARALAENTDSFDHRIWVVDNSGSMQIGDGHRVSEADGKITLQPVTRWEEIQDTVIYHSQMAAVLNSHTRFRLLNDPGPAVGRQEFSVAQSGRDVENDIRQARLVMTRTKPDGVTPLTEHIWEMQAEVRQMLPQLQRTGRRVAVVLATDGLPTDDQGYGGDEITQEFIKALRALEGLPIWLVIRLCTDEESVTDFYNKLDGMLELSLEVLDDFLGESREVRRHNPWLNYALPMHRCRELGYHDRLFDLIDERSLTKGELRDFCGLLFGTDLDVIPDPVVDWKAFTAFVQERLAHEEPQWSPLSKKEKPWISVKKLNKIYNGSSCSIM